MCDLRMFLSTMEVSMGKWTVGDDLWNWDEKAIDDEIGEGIVILLVGFFFWIILFMVMWVVFFKSQPGEHNMWLVYIFGPIWLLLTVFLYYSTRLFWMSLQKKRIIRRKKAREAAEELIRNGGQARPKDSMVRLVVISSLCSMLGISWGVLIGKPVLFALLWFIGVAASQGSAPEGYVWMSTGTRQNFGDLIKIIVAFLFGLLLWLGVSFGVTGFLSARLRGWAHLYNKSVPLAVGLLSCAGGTVLSFYAWSFRLW
jgi:uncharacterized membrane protein